MGTFYILKMIKNLKKIKTMNENDKVKNFKQFINEPKFAYHITRRKNLK